MNRCWGMLSRSAEETHRIGRLFGATASAGAALFLNGELGAGKTCFAQGVAAGLDVPERIPVTSPSYTLLNLYPGRLQLFHFDLYRLTDITELDEIGFDDCLYGDGVTLVEWLDRFPDLQPPGISLQLGYGQKDNERLLSFSPRGGAAGAWLEQVRNRWQTENGPQVPGCQGGKR